MILTRYSYKEFEGMPQEWQLNEIELGRANLIVGKNSAGKSRTLNVMHALSVLLRGKSVQMFHNEFNAHFDNNGSHIHYHIKFGNGKITGEHLIIDGVEKLVRRENGSGFIWAEQLGQNLEFTVPDSSVVIFSKRDQLQHSFAEPIFEWAQSLRHYQFGNRLGKELLILNTPTSSPSVIDETDSNQILGLLKKALAEFPRETFVDTLIADINSIGYSISDFGIARPPTMMAPEAPETLAGIFVQEDDLRGITDQLSMSQGMYRVIAILTHINYLILRGAQSATLLIDDIGEGLDYQRSCLLIERLRSKCAQSGIQLIMSTNDKFVMNAVPLDEWSVLIRKGCVVRAKNIKNSKEEFDDFKFTGLSNFTFWESEYKNN